MAVVGALIIAAAGVYVVVAGGPQLGPIGTLLVLVGVLLLPVNLYLRRRAPRRRRS